MAEVSAFSKLYQQDGSCCINACDPWNQKATKKNLVGGVGDQMTSDGNFDLNLAQEMKKLSLVERERVLEDIHGVAKPQEETPEFVDNIIQKFDASLSKVHVRQRKDINRAMFLWPNLNKDRRFKLMFIRADEYDTDKAAQRMTTYYTEKRRLFGEDKLVKPITIDDLSVEDLKVFQGGFIAQLPIKDQTGRPMIFCDLAKFEPQTMSVDSAARAFWYTLMGALAEEDAQLKGLSVLQTISQANLLKSPASLARFSAMTFQCGTLLGKCLPGRFTSCHCCHGDPRLGYILDIVQMTCDRHVRLRFRGHLGSAVENEYKMMSFGVQCGGLLQGARRGDTTVFENYIQRRREIDLRANQEETQKFAQAGLVDYPGPNDVLIGRGKPYRDFPGNLPWEMMIDSYLEEYQSASTRFDKTCVTIDLVKKLRSQVRFLLERDPSRRGWKILDDVEARQKTASALQNKVKSQRRVHKEEANMTMKMANTIFRADATESLPKRARYE